MFNNTCPTQVFQVIKGKPYDLRKRGFWLLFFFFPSIYGFGRVLLFWFFGVFRGGTWVSFVSSRYNVTTIVFRLNGRFELDER